jgi:DNA-binding GntR family transcriptional regulator
MSITKLHATPAAHHTTPFQTKEEFVADFLREGILAGRFARGERLKQADIAQLLNISNTPVREAFRVLHAEGYVLSVTHRGVIVAPFDAQASREINELRALLEGRITLAAMQNITAGELQRLKGLEREFEAAVASGDREAVRATNYRFHSFLYGLARQPQTLHFVQVLWAKYPFDLINLVRGRPEQAVREHAAILRALASRDEQAALRAVRSHIDAGWKELKTYLDHNATITSATPSTQIKKRRPKEA